MRAKPVRIMGIKVPNQWDLFSSYDGRYIATAIRRKGKIEAVSGTLRFDPKYALPFIQAAIRVAR